MHNQGGCSIWYRKISQVKLGLGVPWETSRAVYRTLNCATIHLHDAMSWVENQFSLACTYLPTKPWTTQGGKLHAVSP